MGRVGGWVSQTGVPNFQNVSRRWANTTSRQRWIGKLHRTYKPLGSGHYQIALFNLKDDLREKSNLAATHPDEVESLNKLLDQWEMEAAMTALPLGK